MCIFNTKSRLPKQLEIAHLMKKDTLFSNN